MPHQCTNCGRGFEDGSQEMLSGCPNCGGNKFQFRPEGDDSSPPADAEPPAPPEPPGSNSTVAKTVGKTAATVRDFVAGDEPSVGAPAPDDQSADGAIQAGPSDTEDAAQASARGDVVSPDELPSEPQREGDHPPESSAPDADQPVEADDTEARPDLKELREELNDQFESIKVLEPGQYELNLMELYDREEYIVALEEDGRYSIQVPETIGK